MCQVTVRGDFAGQQDFFYHHEALVCVNCGDVYKCEFGECFECSRKALVQCLENASIVSKGQCKSCKEKSRYLSRLEEVEREVREKREDSAARYVWWFKGYFMKLVQKSYSLPLNRCPGYIGILLAVVSLGYSVEDAKGMFDEAIEHVMEICYFKKIHSY